MSQKRDSGYPIQNDSVTSMSQVTRTTSSVVGMIIMLVSIIPVIFLSQFLRLKFAVLNLTAFFAAFLLSQVAAFLTCVFVQSLLNLWQEEAARTLKLIYLNYL